jgi:nitronate monooxygenase
MADRVRIPIIAAGGIMDGRGIAAALMLGAKGVQMGTAFLVTNESGAAPVWKKSVLEQYYDSTKITRVFSGRPARSIRNEMMVALEKHESSLPGFPALNVLTRAIRSAAGRGGDAQALSLFAGQAAPLARAMTAADLVHKLALETGRRLDEGFQG